MIDYRTAVTYKDTYLEYSKLGIVNLAYLYKVVQCNKI